MLRYCNLSALLLIIIVMQSAIAAQELKLNEPNTLTVCISKNAYPPMYWKDSGKLTGFDVDAISAIASDIGLEVAFKQMAFAGLLPALMSGRCDILRSGLYVSKKRTNVAKAIPYYLTGPEVLVRKEDSDSITSASDLAGKTVSVQAAAANGPLLEKLSKNLVSRGYKPINIARYPEMPEVVGSVRNYKSDAMVETDMAAISISKKTNLVVAEGFFDVLGTKARTPFGMYFPPNSKILQKIVLQSMKELTRDGTFETIAGKYGIPVRNLVRIDQIRIIGQ